MTDIDVDYDRLDEDLQISPYKLDEDWIAQPQLFMKYSAMSAKLRKLANEAKEAYKIEQAALRCDILEDPKKFLETTKVTNDSIEAYITQDEEMCTLRQQYIDAEYRADMADKAVFALQQKKSALENLVKLQSMEYFGEPQASGDCHTFVREATKKEATKRVAEKTGARRRS